jgi:hypothetical protein
VPVPVVSTPDPGIEGLVVPELVVDPVFVEFTEPEDDPEVPVVAKATLVIQASTRIIILFIAFPFDICSDLL